MRLSLALLIFAATLALLLVEAESQRRQGGGRRPSSRRRGGGEGRLRSPGGREKVMAVRDARKRAESDPNWVRCLNSVDAVPRSQHVITGRVEHVSGKGIRVRVKRVLKGDALPSTIDVTNCDGGCCHLRRKDTRLFLLGTPLEREKVEGGSTRRGGGHDGNDVYPLVATPLRIRLKTLSMIRAAIKDVPYERPPPIQEEPCEQLFCAWGGECQVDEAGVPFCTCPTTCQAPSATTAPVCGTDGKTYETICELRKHSCNTEQEIRISHTGNCDVVHSPTAAESKPRNRNRNRGAFGRDDGGRVRTVSRLRDFSF